MKHIILIIASLFFAQFTFACGDSGMHSEGRACGMIANACMKAGYTREENGHKQFWQDCMKPVILGHKVSGVNVDHRMSQDCRAHKVRELKRELREFGE